MPNKVWGYYAPINTHESLEPGTDAMRVTFCSLCQQPIYDRVWGVPEECQCKEG